MNEIRQHNPKSSSEMSTHHPKQLEPLKKSKSSFILSVVHKNKPVFSKNHKSSLFHSMKIVLIMAQCFSVMPLNGITGRDFSYLKFKWISLKMIYCIFGICGALITTILYVIQFFNNGKEFDDIGIVNVIFFLSAVVGSALFIALAKSWLHLNEKWLDMEYFMKSYPNPPNLMKRFKITTGVIMTLALGEHLLSIIKVAIKSKRCPLAKLDPLKAYFSVSFSHAFALVPYSGWVSFFMEISIVLATFTWNFSNLFVILMCAALAERFQQLNRRVCNLENKSEHFWKEVREDYTRLSQLCKTLDDSICHIVTLAFANNLFFICVQLYHTLKPFMDTIETIYFFSSFGFLIGRTAILSVYCCWINDESKNILTHLFEIPSEEFGTEASRLIQQISFCPVVITGSKYFNVTRSLCLQVAGAIITFELILFQLGPVFLKVDDNEQLVCIT